jgi:hypothetical protein
MKRDERSNMQYPECSNCENYFNGECVLDQPCTDGDMGLSGYEPKSEYEIDYE